MGGFEIQTPGLILVGLMNIHILIPRFFFGGGGGAIAPLKEKNLIGSMCTVSVACLNQ